MWVLGSPAITAWKYNSPLTPDDTLAVSILNVSTPTDVKTVAVLTEAFFVSEIGEGRIPGMGFMAVLNIPKVNCGSNCVVELSYNLTLEDPKTYIQSEVFTILEAKKT